MANKSKNTDLITRNEASEILGNSATAVGNLIAKGEISYVDAEQKLLSRKAVEGILDEYDGMDVEERVRWRPRRWNDFIEDLEAYKAKHGHLDISDKDDHGLFVRAHNQYYFYVKRKGEFVRAADNTYTKRSKDDMEVFEDRRNLLIDMGLMKSRTITWEDRLEQAQEIISGQLGGVPPNHTSDVRFDDGDGPFLRSWIEYNFQLLSSGKLEGDQRKKFLDSNPPLLSASRIARAKGDPNAIRVTSDEDWATRLGHAEEEVSKATTIYDISKRTSQWLSRQRREFRENKMNKVRRHRFQKSDLLNGNLKR